MLARIALTAALVLTAPATAFAQSNAEVAKANDMTTAEARTALADPAADAGKRNRIYYADPEKAEPPMAATAPAPFAYADTFTLHSRPGSDRVVYLDFDGETITGTAWNNDPGFRTPASFYADPFSVDADPAFSAAEMDAIQSTWQRVAEDFAPFAVDVTTEDPGRANIERTGTNDSKFGTRALITGMTEIDEPLRVWRHRLPRRLRRTFQPHAYYQPALVFAGTESGNAKHIAEAVSHEVGHNLALQPRRHARVELLRRPRRMGPDHGRRLLPAGHPVEQGRVHRREHHAGRPQHHHRQRRAQGRRRRRQHRRSRQERRRELEASPSTASSRPTRTSMSSRSRPGRGRPPSACRPRPSARTSTSSSSSSTPQAP